MDASKIADRSVARVIPLRLHLTTAPVRRGGPIEVCITDGPEVRAREDGFRASSDGNFDTLDGQILLGGKVLVAREKGRQAIPAR